MVAAAGVEGFGFSSSSSFLARRSVMAPQELVHTITDVDPTPADETPSGMALMMERLKRVAREGVDANKDGYLARQELVDFALDTREAERQKFTAEEMLRWDRNGDGKVELPELHGLLDKKEQSEEVSAALAVVNEKFQSVDFDSDGALNQDELHIFLHPELHTDSLQLEAQQQMIQLDLNGDHVVDVGELAQGFLGEAQEEHFSSHELELHDHDKDGVLDVHELEELVEGHRFVEHMMSELISLLDTDNDDRISLEEFDVSHPLVLASEAIEDWLFSAHGRDEL